MSRGESIALVLALLGLALLAAGWQMWRSTRHDNLPSEMSAGKKDRPAADAGKPTGSARPADAAAASAAGRMSDREFNRLKVTLPDPINEPWREPFFNSRNCFDPDKKEAAVDVLALWIRKAVLENSSEIASRYFWSLLKLSEDQDPRISARATLAIYRLGDYKGLADSKMRAWMESGEKMSYSDALTGSDPVDYRAQILIELAIGKDANLDQAIYEIWARNRDSEGKDLGSVDYAFFLETRGRSLPAEYWIQRLDNPYGFANALEIVGRNITPETAKKLESRFGQLRASNPASMDAGRAADVAAVLFRHTGEASYRDYLAEQARAQLASSTFEMSLPRLLVGLASTDDEAALEVVAAASRHKNTVVREMAIKALGKSKSPAATDFLFETAILTTKVEKRFPSRELRALLEQGGANADAKYVSLRKMLLSGELDLPATTSDFDDLEFYRQHGF